MLARFYFPLLNILSTHHIEIHWYFESVLLKYLMTHHAIPCSLQRNPILVPYLSQLKP